MQFLLGLIQHCAIHTRIQSCSNMHQHGIPIFTTFNVNNIFKQCTLYNYNFFLFWYVLLTPLLQQFWVGLSDL